MIIRVVAVGRVRDAALREACDAYAQRIRRHHRLEVTEVREAGRKERDAAATMRLESDALFTAVPRGSRIVALARGGEVQTSEHFAQEVERWRLEARDVAFLVGGAYGLDQRLLERADQRISLSRMTLPHELARLVLLEQLYRALTILRGEPYHKGRAG